jgi:hypothetical protein
MQKNDVKTENFQSIIFSEPIWLLRTIRVQGPWATNFVQFFDEFFKIEILPTFHNGGRTGECQTKTKINTKTL